MKLKFWAAIIFTAAIFFAFGWLATIHSLDVSANESEAYVTDMFGLEWIYNNAGATGQQCCFKRREIAPHLHETILWSRK